MPTVDVQVHVYERNHTGRPWAATLHGPSEVTGDQMVAAMDEVGVDGAILVSPYTQYRYDASYALEVRNKHPGRFAVGKPVDPADPKVADTIADWKKTPGTVGIRIMMAAGPLVAPDDAGVNRVLAAAAQHSLPVNVLSWGRIEQLAPLAARNPNTRIVIDHLGLLQPFEPPKPAEPWADLPKLVALAKYEMSWSRSAARARLPRSRSPTRTSGIRCAASSTPSAWTAARGAPTGRARWRSYLQGRVDAFRLTDRLSDSERATLMGGTLQKVYGWAPSKE